MAKWICVTCGTQFPASENPPSGCPTGDTITVVADRNWVSFMCSYPNLIPLPASEVQRIRDAILPYHFERLYAAWFDTIVPAHASEAVCRSANRYIEALNGNLL